MKESKWPDFLFTIAVRFVCGAVLGGLACCLFTWRGILQSFSRNDTYGPLVWLGLCGLAGGIVGVFTVPRWQTPWYKRESDAENLWAEFGSLSQHTSKPSLDIIKKSVTIKTVDEDGQKHEYSSIEEVPPEIRAQIEALEKEAAQESGKEVSVTETSQTGNAITSKIICRKDISLYKIVDQSGVEQVYHSLAEMPPEIRAAVAEAEKRLKA